MRLAHASASIAALATLGALGACSGGPGGGGSLDECLIGWWTTGGLSCDFAGTCDTPPAPAECTFSDCEVHTLSGFLEADAQRPTAEISLSTAERQFSVLAHTDSDTWTLQASTVTIAYGAGGADATLEVRECTTEKIDMDGQLLDRLDAAIGSALEAAIDQGSLTAVAY